MTTAKKPVEGTVIRPAAKTALGGLNALTALEDLVDGTMDFLRIREEERTKRIEIEACASTEVTRIKAAESVLKQYFEHVFAERARTIDGLFEHLDDAMTRADGTAATAALQGIVDLAKSSPLADMGGLTQVRKALDDPDHVWEF